MMENTIKSKAIDYNSPDYKRSRNSYVVQCTLEYFVSLLVTDAFLAKVLTELGMRDFLIGIISSFISLSFVFQLFSIIIVKARISTKKLVITADTISQIFFMLIYIIPFLSIGENIKKALVVFSILIAYAIKYLIISLCYKWANSYVDPKKRATYSANKEIVSLVLGIVFSSVMGAVIDKFEGLGNIKGGFLFIAISMLVLNICNFISLMMIKKENEEYHKADNTSFKTVIKNTLFNKDFRNVIIMASMWSIAQFFSIGFMGVYKTKELMMSVLLVQVINMAANGFRVIISRSFGRFSDKYSYAKGMELALCIAGLGFLLNCFTTPKYWFFIVLHTILFNCAMAGINGNSFNIVYSYVSIEYMSQAMALKNSISGICGFAAAFLGGKVLDCIQKNSNTVFGIHLYGQQVLSLISLVFTIATLLFIHFVIAKQKVKIQ